MLRISRIGAPNHPVAFKLEGRIVGPWAEELRRVTEPFVATEGNLALELGEVTFVDQKGATLLTDLGKRGVKLLHVSPFVAEQLKASASNSLR